ncbi:hypothetical protein [Shivajiella indica]|uniref:Uncharacterized protein n=1 Tax=Shivajiella indica TaxID=872115 RepID=A0ABW5B520_9BACT
MKSRLIHFIIWLCIVVATTLYRDNCVDYESSGTFYPTWLNFVYVVIYFLMMRIIGIGGTAKVNLLVVYGVLLINLPFNFLVKTEGFLFAKFIYLTLGALSIWFIYIPFFVGKKQSHKDAKIH